MKTEGIFLFVINPKAGEKSKHNLNEIIAQKAKQFNASFEIIYTTHKNHAFEIALAVSANKYKVIVAVGGDGTINELGRGLIQKSIPLAIVPMGSGNGLARYLKIPLKTIEAIELAFTGKIMAMDVVQLNNNYSFNVSGLGFDSAVAHQFQHLNKRGFWGYFKLILKQVFLYKPVEIQVDLLLKEGVKNIKSHAFILAIANSNQFGNNAIIAPLADARDGKFNLVIVKPFAWFKMPYYAFMMFSNKFHKISTVINLELDYTIIHTPYKAWHIDGEPVVIDSPIEIKVLPLAIQIIVP